MTRRRFVQAAGASAGALALAGCQVPPRELLAQSRARLAEDILSGYEDWYATLCRQCEAGCGVVVRVIEGRAKKVEGNPAHPVNRGKLCARGQAIVQEQYHPDRLRGPLRRAGARGSGQFQPVSWAEALDALGNRLDQLQRAGQGSAVALLTRPLRAHHALLAERFTEALGAQWLQLDPLAETPLREAVRRVFGEERLPVFDLQHARYVLSFGADFLGTWLSPVHYAVAYGIFRQGRYEAGRFQPRRLQGRPRGYLVQVEPRFSTTAASADEWVPIRPGREGLLALSLAQVILAEGLVPAASAGVFAQPGALDAYEPERVAGETGISPEWIRRLARHFATSGASLALAGGAAAAHTNGSDNVTAVLALNALVGSIGREGGIRFAAPPPLALPPAGRASSLDEWQDFLERARAGQVQVVLVDRVNPVHGLPSALGPREALLQAALIVSFSSFMDETTALADLILPSHLPLEEWGSDIPEPLPGQPVLTLQQPVLQPLYETRAVADVLLDLAARLGGAVRQALPWPTFEALLRDSVQALGTARPAVPEAGAAEAFWEALLQRGGWWEETPGAGGPAPAPGLQVVSGWRPPVFAGEEQEYPHHLVVFPHNTLGRGETAHLPWLQAAPDPITSVVWQTWVEVNPRLTHQLGLREGDVVVLESPYGRIDVPVYIHPAANPAILAVPLGQGHTVFGRWAERRGANPMALLAPLRDEATGALAYGATRVRLSKTDRRVSLPKFEGNVPAFQLPEEEVLKTTHEP